VQNVQNNEPLAHDISELIRREEPTEKKIKNFDLQQKTGFLLSCFGLLRIERKEQKTKLFKNLRSKKFYR